MGLWFPELSNRISMGANDIGLCEIMSLTSEGINSTILTLTSANCEVVVNPEMYTNTIVLAVVYGVCFILLGIGLNKVSLKNTLTGIMILGMICAAVLQHMTEINLLLAIFVFLIICAGVAIPMVNATAVDLFPTNLRGMAISMTILIGRMGTVAGANSIGFLLDVNCSVTFYGIALLALGEHNVTSNKSVPPIHNTNSFIFQPVQYSQLVCQRRTINSYNKQWHNKLHGTKCSVLHQGFKHPTDLN